MRERKFIQELQKRAIEQHNLHESIPFPKVFLFLATYLGSHPWMPLIPLSLVISFLLFLFLGRTYIEFVLWLFRTL